LTNTFTPIFIVRLDERIFIKAYTDYTIEDNLEVVTIVGGG